MKIDAILGIISFALFMATLINIDHLENKAIMKLVNQSISP